MKKLQLFADEAGAAESSETAAQHSAEITDEIAVKNENDAPATPHESDSETAPDKSPSEENGGTEKGEGSGLSELYLMKIAESIASSRLDAAAREQFEREAEETAAVYPSFSLNEAMKNPGFSKLIRLGVPVKTAYEAANFERLLASAMQYAAKKTAEKTARTSTRPGENPVLDRAPSVRKTDVGSLTEKEIRRVIDAASKGAKITFR